MISASATSPSRREFLKVGVATAGTPVGIQLLPAFPPRACISTGGNSAQCFHTHDRAGLITLIMPQVEMGQGVYTSLAMILAEELDASLESVVLEAAPPNEKLYANPAFGVQATGNSNSIRAFWLPLRKAAAGAREMLVKAASQTWSVNPSSLRTVDSTVLHEASGRKLGYGALAARAAGQTPPAGPKLKTKEQFKLIGKPLKRLDTPDKAQWPRALMASMRCRRESSSRHWRPVPYSAVRSVRSIIRPPKRFPVCARSSCLTTWSP
jgi:isoquinoline 1-oxidoreductase beta subunit